MAEEISEVGDQFGWWTIVEKLGKKGRQTKWKCRCTCGRVEEVFAGNVLQGKSTKCGSCAAKERWKRLKRER
jgi:hypothetical protein